MESKGRLNANILYQNRLSRNIAVSELVPILQYFQPLLPSLSAISFLSAEVGSSLLFLLQSVLARNYCQTALEMVKGKLTLKTEYFIVMNILLFLNLLVSSFILSGVLLIPISKTS